MCGIAGVVSSAGASLELLCEMATTLRHRGPDDEGYVVQEVDGAFRCFRGDETVPELGDLAHWKSSGQRRYTVALSHRRLSILDLSPGGHQPMLSPDGNLALVFNGEIYNYLELADELESMGWRLRPCGDTAVLLAAFSEWGPACVHRLRGMWAYAVYDLQARRLTLSRDRFGIKPLYYTRLGDSFVFSSEIKGLLPALPGDPRGSVAEVVRMLAWGGTDDDEATLFEDVRALPAGANLHVSPHDLTWKVERYYDVAASADGEFEGTVGDAVHEYRRRLAESVRLHMRSDVQVGSCLSGGLDSNLAAAMATSDRADGRLATFTAVYDKPDFDERRYVELHAARSGRFETNFVSPTAETLLDELDRLVWAQDQPMASSSPFAQWSVMQLAGEQNIKVLLDGQGADEAIGGYSYFAGAYLLELVRAGHVLRALRAARLLQERRGIRLGSEVGRAAYHQLPLSLRRAARRATRVGYRLVESRYRELAGDPPARVLRTFRDHAVEALRHSLPELLRYEDRSSMAFSIESRVPFLDHPLVELVLSLPTDFKIHDGWSKFVQRKAGEGLLPNEIVWRRDKLGFGTPQQAWKDALADPLRRFIGQASAPPFIDRARLERLVSSDLSSAVALSEFWKTIFLLKWIEVFDVQFSD
jgi:asparagine synthase (glutamine-hydrolysing)